LGYFLKSGSTPAKEGENGTKEKLIFYINSVELKLAENATTISYPLGMIGTFCKT
jgi:hypothetical protein